MNVPVPSSVGDRMRSRFFLLTLSVLAGCAVFEGESQVAAERAANSVELAEIREAARQGGFHPILSAIGFYNPRRNTLTGSALWEPYRVQEDLCVLVEWASTAEVNGEYFVWRPDQNTYWYWLASPSESCSVDTIEEVPDRAISTRDVIPTAAVATILRNSEAILEQARQLGGREVSLGYSLGGQPIREYWTIQESIQYQLSEISLSSMMDDNGINYRAKYVPIYNGPAAGEPDTPFYLGSSILNMRGSEVLSAYGVSVSLSIELNEIVVHSAGPGSRPLT